MVRVLMDVIGCVPRPTGHSLVTLFFLSVSVKERPLHWILVRSQTYYPEHILIYGSREGLLLSCRGFRLFLDRLIRGGDGGGLSTTRSPWLRRGGLESNFGRDLDPLTGEWWVGVSCAWDTSGACVLGYLAGIHWLANCHVTRYGLAMI